MMLGHLIGDTKAARSAGLDTMGVVALACVYVGREPRNAGHSCLLGLAPRRSRVVFAMYIIDLTGWFKWAETTGTCPRAEWLKACPLMPQDNDAEVWGLVLGD